MDQNKAPSDKAMADQAALLSYVDDLVRDRKDPTVNDQNIKLVKAALLQEVNNDINLQMIKLLSDMDKVKLDELLDKNPSDDELNQFFMDKIPNLEQEIAAVLLNFRAAYLLPVMGETPVVPSESLSPPPPPPPAPVAE